MAVHLAPRRLKLGEAVGMPILELGRSMLPGCRRSTHFPGSTQSEAAHPTISLGQHVDDVSNLVNAEDTDKLVGDAVKFTVRSSSVIKTLHIEIPSKSVVVPNTEAAQRISKILRGLRSP